ncbi:hypothetical protein [Kordia sp.]|uniref:hypothetical protein n=1 Tax=Kordia sp. TaxID=1965332 RepID=UPI003D2C1CD6
MKHTKEKINETIKKLMDDLQREYYTYKPITIEFIRNKKIYNPGKLIENCWLVNVPVNDDQFAGELASIIIYIDDDTLKIEAYLDCSMGRPIPLKAIINGNGIYELKEL